jgi:formate hydrogenlyase transcriptional activator
MDSEINLLLTLVHFLALERAELLGRLENESRYFQDEIRHERDLRTLTGDSPAMREVRAAIQQVARTDSTVLIFGETGTGKELVARAIHQLSPRRDHLLVTVNCASLNQSILASELFGHEAGAFTGAAKRRIGRFELADHGTLFLDEIGEVSAETQVLLLRVLQERVMERVGGNEPIAVDVRVIAATNQDLGAAVAQGKFRADLFFRLNVFPLLVPPLRERPQDIADLVRHFVHHFNRRLKRHVSGIDPASLRLLQGYAWPGNVRELENIMERAMITATTDPLTIDPSWLPGIKANDAAGAFAQTQRRAIEMTINRCGGKIYGPGGAAMALGLKPSTLYGKMRRLGIVRNERPL